MFAVMVFVVILVLSLVWAYKFGNFCDVTGYLLVIMMVGVFVLVGCIVMYPNSNGEKLRDVAAQFQQPTLIPTITLEEYNAAVSLQPEQP